jgi:hypothetical protein
MLRVVRITRDVIIVSVVCLSLKETDAMQVKRSIVAVAIFLSACFVSNATLNAYITATDGVVGTDGATGLAGGLVYLVWSLDQTYETPVAGSIPSAPGTPGLTSTAWGNDYILSGWNTPNPNELGSLPDDGGANYGDGLVTGGTIESGYIYVIIFQDGTPSVNDYYGRSSFVAVGDTVPPNPSPLTTVDVTAGLGGNPFVVGSVGVGGQGLQVVPEPSSIALLGLGLGLVALRRKMRK